MTQSMQAMIDNGTARSNYTNILILLLRMRQATSHRDLVTNSTNLDLQEALDVRPDQQPAPVQVDPQPHAGPSTGPFGPSYAFPPGPQQVAHAAAPTCALCSKPFAVGYAAAPGACCAECTAQFAAYDALGPSTKILRCLQMLNMIAKEELAPGAEPHKTIIFSQFTSFFDLLEPFLRQGGYRFARFDGRMNVKQKNEALNRIKTDKRTKVILVSIKSGSVGLNLNVCSRVILLDLWWNPQIENQAFDR